MDIRYKGNLSSYIWSFLQGLIGSVFLTVVFENIARGFLVDFFRNELAGFILLVIVAPIVEEYFKIYPLFRRRAESPETLILFGFLIGLGFGVSEFLIYVLFAKVPVLVRLPGLFFHGASTAIATMGLVKNNLAKYYLIAVILHASVNFFAELGQVYIVGGLGSVILTYILAYIFYRVAED